MNLTMHMGYAIIGIFNVTEQYYPQLNVTMMTSSLHTYFIHYLHTYIVLMLLCRLTNKTFMILDCILTINGTFALVVLIH